MSDVYCAVCGEPWDYYGLKHGDVTPNEARRILAGDGCPCCHFGESCHTCRGTGRVRRNLGTCPTCFNYFTITLITLLHGEERWILQGSVTPQTPRGRVITDPVWAPFPSPERFECRDGYALQKRALCPDCEPDFCPTCHGTGKRTVRDTPNMEALMASALDATDDPDALLDLW
jgi:hypothetical protein